MALFQNKLRIESARLRGWDYGKPGTYYVTQRQGLPIGDTRIVGE
jgi:hypothetical protein